MLVPLPAAVDPVTVASVGDTLSDAYRHLAPHLDRLRRHPDGPRIIVVGAVDTRNAFSPSVPLYVDQIARALEPEAQVVIADARPWVRRQAEQSGVEVHPVKRLRGLSAPLVIDCSTDPRGMAIALRATSPDGLCSCAGSLHTQVKIPASLMFGRNITLAVGRSHIRTVMPAVLDLVATGRVRPERVTTTVAPFADGAEVLRDHLLAQRTKTVLLGTV
jgi:alcohol dehydrogenase